MSNKNPFEIRAEMVALAKDYLDAQHQLNLQLINNLYEQGKRSVDEVNDAYKMYTMDELMAKAKEMYSFVSTKD